MNKGNGLRYCKVQVFYLEHEEKQYLTFENVYYEGQGKGKKNKTEMISNFEVNTNVANEILDRFSHKKERIDII